MNRTFTAAAAAIATLTVLGTGTSAFAKTTRVEVADLNLATAEGQAELDKRLDRAARQVCKGEVTGSRVARVDAACVAKTRAAIAEQLAARNPQSRSGG